MEKLNVYRDLLMLYIKDNYRADKNNILTATECIKIENTVLAFIKTQLGKKGVKIYASWYMKFYECNDIKICEDVYEDAEKDKSIKHDFLMKLAKPYDTDNSLDKYKTEEDILEEQYQEMKLEFEKTHFKCKDNYYIIENNSLSPYNKTSFINIYEDKYIDEENEYLFITKWIKDPVKRSYSRIDFLPNGSEEGVFNMWDIVRKEDHEITEDVNTEDLHELVFKVCGNKEENYDYFMKYLAHLIQYPEKKPEVCIFFTSEQGSGKDTVIELITKLIGNVLIGFENDPERIFGKFNMGTRQNKLVVVLQEADNIKSYAGKIKDLITCKQTTLEQKNVRSFTIKDYTRLLILSNNENIIKIEPGDRRFVVFKCYNFKFDPDPDFFTNVIECINNPNCIQKFLEELRTLDVSKDFNFQLNRPHTEIYNNLKEANTPAIIKWVWELTENKKIDKISPSKMCEMFNDYCAETYEQSNRVNPKSFGLMLGKYFYINDEWIGFEKTRSHGNNYYQIRKEELKDIIENHYKYIGEV